jgi:predicted aldo/keto reductase-like oxidoreductase
LGKTGLKVSVVGFGGIPIMNIPEKEAINVVNRAIDLGVNLFHTSVGTQGYGDSAKKIGKAIERRRDECVLNVKVFCQTRERAETELAKTLRALNTDRIEIAQCRLTEQLYEQGMGEKGGFQVLKDAQDEGIIEQIGITDHDPKFLIEAITTGIFSNVIVPFNYVYNEAREKLIPLAKKMNIGIIGMKSLGGWNAGGPLKNISESLNYIWQHEVSTTIIGMKTIREVEENTRLGGDIQPLTLEQEDRLSESARDLRKKYEVVNGALLPRKTTF